MSEDRRYQQLAAKWLNNTISPEEREEFVAWYNRQQDASFIVPPDTASDEEEHRRKILEKINREIGYSAPKNKRKFSRKNLWYAAALVLLFGPIVYLWRKDARITAASRLSLQNDIAPGGNKATLMLANGKTIELDGLGNGPVANEAGLTVNKKVDGKLHYQLNPSSGTDTGKTDYNTIKTPMGGQYEVILSDGSTVWLNANSSLTFPARFPQSERRVKLTGEAYFSIKSQAGQKEPPFIVDSPNQEVYVMGTEFNVNAYEDENQSRTSLLKGAIKVKRSTNNVCEVLKPGQQALISPSDASIDVQTTDLSESIAWKNGYFDFRDADIQSIMRQFARWYNVDVQFDGPPQTDLFVGKIPRSLSMNKALIVLAKVGIRYRIEGRKLIVQNQENKNPGGTM